MTNMVQRIMELLYISIVCLLLSSCLTNKTVYLIPSEPLSVEENEIIIGIPKQQEYWIYFDPDEYSLEFSVYVCTNNIPENMKCTSLQLVIDELDIKIDKNNIDIPVNNFIISGI